MSTNFPEDAEDELFSGSLEYHSQYDGENAEDPAVICKAAEFTLFKKLSHKAEGADPGQHGRKHPYEIGRNILNVYPLTESIDQT